MKTRPYNEIEAMFNSDCRDKKTVAHSARNKVTPGKGSRRAWSRTNNQGLLNGPTYIYQLNRPLSWRAFTATKPEILAMYLKALKARFHIGEDALPAMLHAKPIAVHKFLLSNGLKNILPATDKDMLKADWEEFCRTLWGIPFEERDESPIVAELVPSKAEQDAGLRRDCADAIVEFCKKNDTSIKQLAHTMGQPYSTVYAATKQKVSPNTCRIYLDVIKSLPAMPEQKEAEAPITAPAEPKVTVEKTPVTQKDEIINDDKFDILTLKGPAPAVIAAIQAMMDGSPEVITLTLKKQKFEV